MTVYGLREKNSRREKRSCRNTRSFFLFDRFFFYKSNFIGCEIFRDFLENKKLTIQQPSNPTKRLLK